MPTAPKKVPKSQGPVPQFSLHEAQALVLTAREAPLTNMKEAEDRSRLLAKFSAWFNHVSSKET